MQLLVVIYISFSVFRSVQSDLAVARQLFCVLLSAILDQVDEELPKKDAANLTSKINTCLNGMLSSTTQFHMPFVACILVKCLVCFSSLWKMR